MDKESFNELLQTITPLIEQKDTMMRKAISPMGHISIKLCYLALWNTFEDIKLIIAISPQTIELYPLEPMRLSFPVWTGTQTQVT